MQGSFRCSCNTGYTLDSNGYTCDGMLTQLIQLNLYSCLSRDCLQMLTSAAQTLLMPASISVSTFLGLTHASVMLDTS